MVSTGRLSSLATPKCIAARSQGEDQAAIERLQKVTGKNGIFLKLDLANLQAVKQAAEEFLGLVHCLFRWALVN